MKSAAESPPTRWAILWSEKDLVFRILSLEDCICAGLLAFLGARPGDLILVGLVETPLRAEWTVAQLEQARGLVWNADAKAWLKESNHLETSA
jgi:hypothetical protein